MSLRRHAVLVGLALIVPALAVAQQGAPPRPGQPVPRRPAGAPVDTTRRDSTRAEPPAEIVKWAETDSVMEALLRRQGYAPTRYQGERVTFDATGKAIRIEGEAAVGREQTILVGDTVIYNDVTKIVRALGDTVILRDPTQGADIVAQHRIAYNVATREGIVSRLSTSVESGQVWYVEGKNAVFRGDTTPAKQTKFYAHDASLTSCNEIEPHYHFKTGEIKVVTKNLMVARPAVLYIADIPVMWLPFVFQDMRSGRRSGMLTPRFGVSDIVRNSPQYRRTVDNMGYYFALSDYMDAQVALDWRSGASPTAGDPGFLRWNGEWRYRWLSRFMTGRISASRLSQDDGATNTSVSFSHAQEFSKDSRVSANVNYVTNTTVQRRTSFDPYATLATIRSSANYQNRLGPFNFSVGGSRSQYPGRAQVDQDFPNISLPSKPINIGKKIVWTPSLGITNSQRFHIDQGSAFGFRYTQREDGAVDSVRIDRSTRNTGLNFDTPLRIFDFSWRNSVRISDQENKEPLSRVVYSSLTDTSQKSTRVFARTYSTEIDWQTGIDLPRIAQGTWNIVPSVSLSNVDGRSYWIRTDLSGGNFVHQTRRLLYGLSSSPTFFGLFPGFGPVSRFRHSVTPSLTYSFAPRAELPDEYLRALNRTRTGNLTTLAQNQITLGLTQNIEAKLRSASDTNPDDGKKIRLLTLNFTPLTYDFERARHSKTGWDTDRFSYSLRSDLLPGFNLDVGYSLFQGDVRSDTAVFKPYRETINASFSLNSRSRIFSPFTRLFGRRSEPTPPPDEELKPVVPESDVFANRVATQQVTGSVPRAAQFAIPGAGQGWQGTFNFTSSRRRPVIGGGVVTIDPTQECLFLQEVNPFSYQQCVDAKRLAPGLDPTTDSPVAGGQIFRSAPTTALQGSISFNVTAKWAAQWQTTYDFELSQFASHIVSLQRELHDWRAIFAFTQSPNGNFAFNFFISLKAEPDLKFDYNRQTYRRQ
jgi:hypothetical protein